jgi:hypothetical protein
MTLWPDGKTFAFTIFDDTDSATLDNVAPIYRMLTDLGIRITKSVWTMTGKNMTATGGITCDDVTYRKWCQELTREGFEIAFHNATFDTSVRVETIEGLERFREYFGYYPRSMANHADCLENIYWGDQRVGPMNRMLYNMITRGRYRKRFRGHVEGDDHFWGDLCQKHVSYVRNFVFRDINTLKECPFMPYHDPDRPYVNFWFASSEAPNIHAFNRLLCEENQDRLEREGGACIVYTHLASGFFNGGIDRTFEGIMKRLAKKNGWFVPVSTLLDYLRTQEGWPGSITARERGRLELKWLLHKMRVGST